MWRPRMVKWWLRIGEESEIEQEGRESTVQAKEPPRQSVAIGDALPDSISPLRRTVPPLRYASPEFSAGAESPSSGRLKSKATDPAPSPIIAA
ncbi:hypothetical protein NL676_025261 [Syzygium grande]|nr:hypothetical protein NL676_025261 [Syzygium grande]